MARATTKTAATATPRSAGGKKPSASPRPPATRRKRQSLEDAIVTLATTGQLAEAARSAARDQRKAGLPVTYQRGNEIIKEFPDGRRVVLATLQPPDYRLPKGVARIRNRNARDQ